MATDSLAGALMMRGPTLSPVSLLCATWDPSQAGNVPDLQQRHMTALP
eukprot:CAMPEP_0174352468 /NCGR_PEP_ID=MMETSP0811_2-20130205/10839_1 /TAXON_ID=73025 ORGANISM="Eutreptiella gymnastica-like, Strain CCMP1594" /NCGR_SAMPLE_ID=MMETSP0811_2 /ASSEMBLY_ACC=CAM_ASM_000667 /LENGTH=47 /DNA_ID= /DNA_START= /DNA_END= /DNA_ORIENTATION=